jgi:multiple sugar transport system substrate-binding protein
MGIGAAGCGAQGAAPPEGGATASKQPVTVRLNYRTDKYIAERATEFSATYPWITVEQIPGSGYEKLLVLVAAGEMGDLVWDSVGVGAYLYLAFQGHLKAIDPFVTRDKFDLRQYYPRTIETARVDGKLYGLPATTHPGTIGLFYNVNLFEQAGISPPTSEWTTDDLVAAARRLSTAVGADGKAERWGVAIQTSYTALVCVLRTFGGEYTDPPSFGKKATLDRPAAKQALQWLYDLRHRHRVHPTPAAGAVNFVDGNLGMYQGITSNIKLAEDAKDRFKVDVALIPKGPGGKRGSMLHFGLLAINGATKVPDQAFELQKWLTNKESALRQFRVDGGIPGARPDAWNDPEPVRVKPLFKLFRDFMEKEGPGPLPVPWNLKMPEIQQLSDKQLAPLWTGEQSVDQVVTAAMGPFQTLLDTPR